MDADGNPLMNIGEYDTYLELQNYNKQMMQDNEMKK